MNTIKKIFCAFGVAVALSAQPSVAQTTLPDGAQPMIVIPHNQSIDYNERTLCFNVLANVDYDIAINQSWATMRLGSDSTIYVHIPANYYETPRTVALTFTSADETITQTLYITQGADASAETIPTDDRIYPSSATDNSHTSSGNDGGVANTYDDDYSTLYHSAYSGTTFIVSESNPAILTYYFTDVDSINYVTYVPRTDGSENGLFGKVQLYVQANGQSELTLYGTYDFNYSDNSTTITFSDALINPTAVQFRVLSGGNNYASCAEMEFYAATSNLADFSIFGDDVYSTLREGVTASDIEQLTNPFAKSLATKIFEGNYSTDYRVAEFPCLLSVEALAESWNCPGKYYDQFAGVTGITYGPGTYGVAVSGLPEGKSATLKIVAWYNGVIGTNFDGGNPQVTSYTLKNGLNVIEYDPENDLSYDGDYISDYDGLAYIEYDDDTDPDSYSDIKVHFINGVVNGYLSEDKTNDEMSEILLNAKNKHMDVLSEKVHAVWTADGLYNYCRSTSGGAGYRQYMNVLDSLIVWEHDLLGFIKYDHVPENRTFAYVNYTYYMFQGTYGVSFIYSQESRVLNCNTIINNDNDAIWGLSHEWGHQHQMHPYFCWTGMTEVTNNMNSYYNIMKMGYKTSDKIENWDPARAHFIEDEVSDVTVSSIRRAAYENRSSVTWNDDFYALATAMADSAITTYADNPARAIGLSDVSVGETLCPFIMLYVYFTTNGFPDFAQDWYEALRQTDQDGGSTIEKSDGVDKYELIAAAQNSNSNGAIALLNEAYPNSVWCDYITTSNCSSSQNSMPFVLNYIRKVSRLSGYNLFPYFERWGFLRQVATYIYDYGYGWSFFTEDAYNEFKNDMDALVADGTLKEMPEGMVEEISNTADMFMSKPTFPN